MSPKKSESRTKIKTPSRQKEPAPPVLSLQKMMEAATEQKDTEMMEDSEGE